MKRTRMSDRLYVILLIGAMLALIFLPGTAAAAAAEGLQLCGNTLIPSLFPFFVCANLIAELGLAAKLSAFSAPVLQKLFGISAAACSAFVLGLIGGYPAGAQMCTNLYASGAITKQEAERLVKFCNNAGPAFIFGVMGSGIFGSFRCGIILFLSQLLSAIFIGLLQKKRSTALFTKKSAPFDARSFPEAFTNAVKKAGQSVLQICMFVTVFSVISAFLSPLFLRIVPESVSPILRGMLELSSGARALKEAALPTAGKLAAASFLLAFSGLSVCAQTVSVLQQADLSGDGILTFKLLQGIIAAVCAIVFRLAIPEARELPVMQSGAKPSFFGMILLFSGAAVIICCVFLKLSSRNRKKKYV